MEAIVEAVFRILESDGERAVTTTRVAEVAGVSVGSLYQYFPSRESLLAEARRSFYDQTLRALDRASAATARDASLETRLVELMGALLAHKRGRPALTRALHRLPALPAHFDKPRFADVCQRRLARLLEAQRHQLVSEGAGEPDCAAIAARLVGAVEGALARSLRVEQGLASPALDAVLARVVRAALGPA